MFTFLIEADYIYIYMIKSSIHLFNWKGQIDDMGCYC